jgi:hypothetical protein
MSHAHAVSTTIPAWNSTAVLLERLFPPPRAFTLRLWDGTELPADRDPAFWLILNHPGALRRMFTPPIELSVGEAFIYGDFNVDGASSRSSRCSTTSPPARSRRVISPQCQPDLAGNAGRREEQPAAHPR